MRSFVIENVHPTAVKSIKNRELFSDDEQVVSITEAYVDVERLANLRVELRDEEFGDLDAEKRRLPSDDTDDSASVPPISFGPNPREQKLKTAIPRQVQESLLLKDGLFHLKNRGIVLTAGKVKYDNSTRELRIVEDDPDLHGVVDGGHTYRIIFNGVRSSAWSKSEGKPQFVRLEIIEGLDANQIPLVAGARNSSVNVEEFALAELEKAFEWIKEVLREYKMADLVAFKQNEDRPLDIVEVLQRLTVVDNVTYDDDQNQPYQAYWSRAKATPLYKKKQSEYHRLRDLLPDLLALPEYILLKYGAWYSESGGKTGGKHAKFKGTKEVRDRRRTLDFLPIVKPGSETETDYVLSPALIMPILGSLRVIVSHDREKARWLHDPYDFLDRVGPRLVETTNESLRDQKNEALVGKSKGHWRALYREASLTAMKMGVVSPTSVTV